MPYVASPFDQAQLYYKDYRPVKNPQSFKPVSRTTQSLNNSTACLVFIHGWPMSGKMFEHLMLVLCESHGIRCIAIDRRGFGKSEWSGCGTGDITYEIFALDTVHILMQLTDMNAFVFVGASMGCGETVLAWEILVQQNLQGRCQGFIWLGPSMPFPLKTDTNPKAPSRELWDSILVGMRQDRPAFVRSSIGGVFGISLGIEMSNAATEHYVQIVAEADSLAMERCVQIMLDMDFTPKLKDSGIGGVKILILHGENDQGMPMEASTYLIKNIIPPAQVKVYRSAAHGLYWTHATQVVDDIVDFLRSA